ncbi:MAG: ATP-binding protein [Chloroflexi bacterium]|nr:ATP-binding protein [Chloroflexota bacterium]
MKDKRLHSGQENTDSIRAQNNNGKFNGFSEEKSQQDRNHESFSSENIVPDYLESDDKYRIVVESSLVGVVIDDGREVEYCNRAFETITGFTFEEVVKNSELIELLKCVKQVYGTTKDSIYTRLLIRFKDKHDNYLALRAERISTILNSKLRYITYLVDVTGEEEAREALKTSEEHFRRLLETAPDLIWEVNLEGNLVTVNRAGSELLGYSPGQMLGKPFKQFIQLQEGETIYGRFAKLMENPDDTITTDLILNTRGEQNLNCEAKVWLRKDERGLPLNFVVLMRDLTERIKVMKQIRALVEELEEKNIELEKRRAAAEDLSELKSQFVANTSHELRTPLNTILGFLRLIMDGYYENEEELKEFINFSYKSAQHLLSLINDILDIAKMEAGKMKVQIRTVDIGYLFKDVKESITIQAREKNLYLHTELEKDCMISIKTDPNKLKQILLNLVSNSIKFTHEGGIVLKAFTKPGEDLIIIDVEDSGIGIPDSQKTRIFEPFVQGDGKSTRRYGGTGLGLTISTRLAELLGGELFILESENNKGTTMRLVLPIALKQER